MGSGCSAVSKKETVVENFEQTVENEDSLTIHKCEKREHNIDSGILLPGQLVKKYKKFQAVFPTLQEEEESEEEDICVPENSVVHKGFIVELLEPEQLKLSKHFLKRIGHEDVLCGKSREIQLKELYKSTPGCSTGPGFSSDPRWNAEGGENSEGSSQDIQLPGQLESTSGSDFVSPKDLYVRRDICLDGPQVAGKSKKGYLKKSLLRKVYDAISEHKAKRKEDKGSKKKVPRFRRKNKVAPQDEAWSSIAATVVKNKYKPSDEPEFSNVIMETPLEEE